jgi:hypothetical protein
MHVPQFAPVHSAAVRKDDFAINSKRRVVLDPGDPEHKGEDVKIRRNRPEDI